MRNDEMDRLRTADPHQPERAPAPPAMLLDEIMEGRRGTVQAAPTPIGWLVAVAAALVVLVVGGAWLLWLAPTGESPGNVAGTGDITTVGPPTTLGQSAVVSGSTVVTGDTGPVPPQVLAVADGQIVYLVDEASGTLRPSVRPGDFWVDGPPISELLDEALSAAEIDAGLVTMIPSGVVVDSLENNNDGSITVTFRGEFNTGESERQFLALAQLVYTLTAPGSALEHGDDAPLDVESVQILGDGGVPQSYSLDLPDGRVELGPVITRSDFERLLPVVAADLPPTRTDAGLLVTGTNRLEGGTATVSLIARDGTVLWSASVDVGDTFIDTSTATPSQPGGLSWVRCGGEDCSRGEWTAEIMLAPPVADQPVLLRVSAQPTSASAVTIEYPLFLDGRSSGACSAWGAAGPSPQQGLPPDVSALRDTIFGHAANCNWSMLDELTGDLFVWNFGGLEGTPSQYWQTLEGNEVSALEALVAVLDMSSGTAPNGPLTRYVWPAAATYDSWADVPPDARDELLEIHRPEELRAFEEFGVYAGWRAGILEDGTWLFFVAGD